MTDAFFVTMKPGPRSYEDILQIFGGRSWVRSWCQINNYSGSDIPFSEKFCFMIYKGSPDKRYYWFEVWLNSG
ncbi:unnamed protein product [Rhizophagus irregularis]|nr:unnamed protein product [Rhizophagus irregularis]